MMEAVTNSAQAPQSPLQAQEKSPAEASQARKKPKPSPIDGDFQGALALASGAPVMGASSRVEPKASVANEPKASVLNEPKAGMPNAPKASVLEAGQKQANLAAQQPQAAPGVDPKGKQAAQQPRTASGIDPQTQRVSNLRASSAEKSPQTQKAAASTNAAAAIAGPKPWSTDWVFVGGEANDPELKPLLDAASKPAVAGASPRAAKGGEVGAAAGPERARAVAAANGVLTGAAPLDPELAAQLAALGAYLDSGPESSRGPARNQVAGSLTGAEFIETLNGSKPRTEGAGRPGQHGLGQGSEGRNPLGAEPTRPGSGPRGQSPRALQAAGGRLKLKAEDLVLPSGVGGGESHRPLATAIPPAIVAGHVVKGSMARDRLSHEALNGVSSGVRNLYLQGGGEMVVRLKPDTLGELHLRVVTNGRDVGLKIRASDSQAKQVLEDSMGYLRDSLAQQQLQLSRVDVTVVGQPERAAASAFGGSFAGDSGSGGQPSHSGSSGNSGGDLSGAWAQAGWSGAGSSGSGGRPNWELSGSEDASVRSVSGMRTRAASVPQAAGSSGTVSQARVANGRIDVMA